MLNVSRICYNGINNLIALLNKAKDKLAKKEEVDNPFLFDDLSPEDKITNGETYFSALKWALENKDVQNIALSGPYGSGKSSVLRSFEKKHPEYKYLNISLASFHDGAFGNETPKPFTPEEFRLIEISILQQMFYKVKASKIPDSRFKRIRSINRYLLALYIILAIATGLSILILFEPAFLKHFDFWENIAGKNIVWIACLLVIAIAASVVTTYLIRLFNSKQFEKVSLSTGEIEIGAGNEKSILNKHLDEIIYFFSKNPFTVVTIEDLDRFNTHEIFTKLRELNLLINLSRAPENKIKFLYAIKDDIFKDKTRTKFFDFIVPVLPVVNSSNSYAVLRNKIDAQKTIKIDLNDNFIRDITLFIDDMRILKNIFNEFILYQQNLKSLSLNHNTLLGIIIYKNVYPDDFASLHENKGIVFEAFNSVRALKEELVVQNLNTVEEIVKKVSAINSLAAKNIDELKAIYIHKVWSLAENTYLLSTPSGNIRISQTLEDRHFNEIKNFQSFTLYSQNQGRITINKTFKEIENSINPSQGFNERKDLIEKYNNKHITQLEADRSALLQQNLLINSYSLKELFDENPQAIDLFDKKLLEKKLLVYLIREGYINEMYPSLITYFYEGGLMKVDMDYLLSIKNNSPQPQTLKIIKIGEIVKSVTLLELKRVAALNVRLLDFLLKNRNTNKERINSLLSQFEQAKAVHVDFIVNFINEGKEKGFFIELLSEKWSDIWLKISREKKVPENVKLEIAKLLVLNLKDSQLLAINKETSLSDYLMDRSDFLSFFPDKGYHKKVIEAIKGLGLYFSKLDVFDSENEIFNYIYESSHIILNPYMVDLMIKHKSTIEITPQLFNEKNYSAIQQSGCLPLIKDVEENIELYIEDCFLVIDPNDEEPTEVVINLLNKEDIPVELKKKIIEKEKAIIEDIDAIPEELWQHSLENKKAKISWENLVNYYSSIEEMDDTVINILNRPDNFEILGQTKMTPAALPDGTLGDAAERAIAEDIVTNEKLSDLSLQHLVNAIPYEYEALDSQDISDSKLTILLQAGKYLLTPENFNYVKSRPALKLKLLEKYPTIFAGQLATFNPDPGDIHPFLQSAKVESMHKELLLENLPARLLTNQHELADVALDLVKNSSLVLIFEKLSALFINAHNLENKLIYLVNIVPDIDEQECLQLMALLPEPYFYLTEKGRRPVFPNNPINLELISSLHHHGYISSFKIDDKEDRIKVYTKTAD